jgi:hypothetical protein
VEQQQNVRFIAAQERGQQQIDRALNEALGRVVTRNVCSLVVERNNTYGWNNAMDITSAVTRLAPTRPRPHVSTMPPTISLQHVEVHPGSSTERLPALGGRAA